MIKFRPMKKEKKKKRKEHEYVNYAIRSICVYSCSSAHQEIRVRVLVQEGTSIVTRAGFAASFGAQFDGQIFA